MCVRLDLPHGDVNPPAQFRFTLGKSRTPSTKNGRRTLRPRSGEPDRRHPSVTKQAATLWLGNPCLARVLGYPLGGLPLFCGITSPPDIADSL